MIIEYIRKSDQAEPAPKATEPIIQPITADQTQISYTAQEALLDFLADSTLRARIIAPPAIFKSIYQQLEMHVGQFEDAHGQIRLPKRQKESLLSELKRNLFRDHKVSQNLRVINPMRKKTETRRKKS